MPTTIEFLDLTQYHADPDLDCHFTETGCVSSSPDFSPFDPISTPSCFDHLSDTDSLPSFDDFPLDFDPTKLSILQDDLHPDHTSSSPCAASVHAPHAMSNFLHEFPTCSRYEIYQLKNIASLFDPDNENDPHRAHIDGGSMVTTASLPDFVCHLRPIKPFSVRLNVADNEAHFPTHRGYL